MSLQIKSLRSVIVPRIPDSRKDQESDPNQRLNRIPLDGAIYDLYVAPSSTAEMKAAIVKSIRVLNNTVSGAAVINLYYTDDILLPNMMPSKSDCRRRRTSAKDIVLPKGFTYIDDSEVTVEAGARIQGSARLETGTPVAADFVDYVISGVERDVT